MKLEEQDKRISQEQQKEKRRIAKLQQEIGKTDKECHDLTNRIKVYILYATTTSLYSLRKSLRAGVP